MIVVLWYKLDIDSNSGLWLCRLGDYRESASPLSSIWSKDDYMLADQIADDLSQARHYSMIFQSSPAAQRLTPVSVGEFEARSDP